MSDEGDLRDTTPPPEPRPILTERDLQPVRQIPVSGEVLGLIAVVGLGILMVGFILGRVTAPDGDDSPTPSTTAASATGTISFPAGDVDRSGYWQFASITPAVIDAFDREDDPTSLGEAVTGGRWTSVSGTWGVEGGRAAVPAGNSDQPRIAVIDGGAVERLVEASLMSVRPGAGLVFRYQDPDNFWAVTAEPSRGAWAVLKVVDGAAENVGFVEAGVSDGVTLSVSLRPARVIVLVDGLVEGQFDDRALGSEVRSGLIALPEAGGGARWDRFYIGDLPPAG